MGMPTAFVRLTGCNLRCDWCDTLFAYDEGEEMSIEELIDAIEDMGTKQVCITGGEPLIQQRKIIDLLAKMSDWDVEIETNGTIMPNPELRSCQFNCSPTLENSGNLLRRRYKPKVLEVINNLTRSQFKFVVSDTTDLIEIDSIVKECYLDPEKIVIMPEGQSAEVVAMHAEKIDEAVRSRGWNITMRNQLIWYGPKRRT